MRRKELAMQNTSMELTMLTEDEINEFAEKTKKDVDNLKEMDKSNISDSDREALDRVLLIMETTLEELTSK